MARNAYSLSTAIDGTWSLIEGIVIGNLQLAAGVGARSYAYLSGDLIIGDADEQATLSLAARYADGSWSFAGDQAHGSISLTRLAKLFLPDTQQLPAAAPGSGPLDIELDRLHAEIDAGAQTYRFAARVRWQPLAALPELEAMVEVAKLADSAGAPRYVGQLSATGRLFGADVGFRLPFGDSTKVEVQLWDIWAVYEEGVIRFRLSGMSLGQLLTELTSWVTRNRRPVALPSPWNLLNSVALDDFTLQFDTNDKRFTVTYKVPGCGIDLGFYVLQGFEMSSGGENTGLRFELVGHGLVDAEPWDATQPDQAPKVPGISDLFELRLLVLGQHVAVPGQDQFDSVPEAIAGFKRLGPPRENEVPVSVDGTGRYPQFDSASNWLVAADFGLLAIGGAERRALVERLGASAPRHLIEAAFVFIDPALYGFRIAIASEARLLAGLEFEILYKKLSDNLGVYQIELDLPDAVRSLDVGALAVTMPQIAVEIFTNGDFLVDLGYPHERDFSRSFMLQGLVPPGLPMLGSGGFYFGALSGGSCDRLPVTRRGTFSPVTAFGIGLMVGFGRSIDKGPLKAGFSLTIVAFIEGVIARFNPTEDARPAPFGATLDDDHYYWLRGTFGLQGQLYGTVDFKLVKARLDAGFSALVSATYESFQPTVLDLVAGVSVAASIRIHLGFFSLKISYSFTIRISERIVLGARAPAPWDDPALAVPAAVPLAFEPLWTPLPAPEPVPLTLYFAPALTIVGDAAETLADQQAAYAAMLFIDAGSDTSASSFELFCRELLCFLAASVVAGTGGRPERDGIDAQLVTLAELERLYGRLTDSQTPSPLPYSAIAEFMSTHFRIEVHAPASADAPEERQAAAFPMLPALRFVLAADGGTLANVDFAGYNPVEGAYLDQIQAQFDALQLAVERQLDPRRAKLPRVRADADQPPAPSMATVVMEDYVGLCARHVVQAALDAMRDYRYSLQPGDTLGAIVAWANAAGNAVSAARILEANAGLPLAPGKTWTLPQVDPDAPQQPGLRYSATQEDSLELIAGRFAAGQDAAFLQQLVALNLTSTGLLVPGVTVALGGRSHVVAGGDSWQSLAAALEKAPADLLADAGIVQSTALIQRLGIWDIPSITCVSDDENFRTAAAIAEHYGLPVGALALAGANLEIADPFAPAAEDEAQTLSLPDLTSLSVGSLFAETQHCQSLEHLAGMTSRFLLHGLRLPGPAGSEAPGEDVPLYALTGQQHVLPENLTGLTVTLEKDASDAWIELQNAADPTRLVVPADATEQQRIDAVRAYARRHGVVPDVRYLGPAPVFRDDPATFPLRDNIPWQNGGRIVLPQESAEAPDVLDLRIWLLPPGLRKLLEAGRNTLPPALVLEIGAQNATTGSLESRSSSAFAWSTLLDFDVQRFTNAEQPPTTSQLMGATADSTRLLQELLMSLGDDPARIHGVTLLYRASATAKRSAGLQSDGDKDIVFFLNRVNLSTQTNPGPAYGRTAAPIPAAWNGPLGFLSLLWNGSITRSGGYYLFYQNQSTREGLPDRIFDEHGRARLSVLVTWQPAGDEASDHLPPYLNTVVTGDSIEVDRASVFARVTPQRIEHPLAADDTLATLARYYCSKIGTLCAANSSRALNQDADISIDEFWYEVRPDKREPGGMLANIAAYFRVDPARIKDLNPDLGDAEPVAPYRLLRIPSTVLSLADTTFKTLADIRDRYAVSYDALGFANRDTAALFADTTLVVDAGLTLRTPTAQMGAAGMVLERAAPAQTPQSPQDAAYAERYLLNLYDLLGYRVADTLAFDKSPAGLPMGPTVDVPDGALVSKRQSLPLAGAASAAWQYHETLPAARFARSSPVTAPPGVLEPEPPYAGVGEAVQLELAWQDAFGNRALSPFQNPDLDAGHPLNFPPLPLGFTDRIVGFTAWPSVALAYRLTGGPALVVRLDFDPSRYLPTALSSRPSRVLANTPQWQENAQKDLLIYERIHAQLQHRDRSGVPSLSIGLTTTLRKAINASQPLDDATLAELRDWVAAIYTYLHVRACGEDAPAPTAGVDMRQALRTEELNASAVFSVTVALECEREIALVHPAFKDAPEVCRVITPVSAATRNAAGQQSLVDFAAAFEAAFAEAEVQLKVAASPRGEGGRTAMYAVRFGADGATSIGLRTEGAPLFTAVRPLCTELISRAKVPVHAYETGKGIDWDGTTVPVNASAVDLDAWAWDFLADFDRILAPEISTPMFIVDRVAGCDFRDRLLAAKERLADAIALQVAPVLKHQSIAQEVLAAARETLRQQLLIRLGEAYEVDGIAQYPFAVSTPFADVADAPAPRLRGAIVVKEGAVADSDQLSLIPGPLSLAPTTGTGRNYLNVLLRTQNDTEVERLTLDLDWQVSHLELDIRREASLGEYEGSTWLSFLLPAGRRSQAALPAPLRVSLGEAAQMPVPLRAFPKPPSMRLQRFDAVPATGIADIGRWNYEFGYAVKHNRHDVIDAEVYFNVNLGDAAASDAGGRYLPDDLLQYRKVRGAVMEDLQAALKRVDGTSDTEAAAVKAALAPLAALTSLVEHVVEAWDLWVNRTAFRVAPDFTASDSMAFRIQEDPDDSRGGALQVRIVAPNDMPGMPVVSVPGWVTESDPQRPGVYRYRASGDKPEYLGFEAALAIAERNVVVPNLAVVLRQNAWASVVVVRNDKLIENAYSRPEFVYRTQPAFFANPLNPILRFDAAIDIAALGDHPGPRQLNVHLRALLDAVFDARAGATLRLQMTVECRYQVNASTPELSQPVVFVPTYVLARTGLQNTEALAEDLAEALGGWRYLHPVQVPDGRFNFALQLISQDAGAPLPILTLPEVFLRLADILPGSG